jgi:hypothetical protein
VKVGYARLSKQPRDLVLRRRAFGAIRPKGKEFFRPWRSSHPASLLTIALVLWLGAFLFYWAAVPKSEASRASLTTAGAPHTGHVANGYEPPIDGNYLAVSADEDELGDELPPNAMLLTVLVFVHSYGTVMRCCLPSIGRRHQRRPVPALLEVLRL